MRPEAEESLGLQEVGDSPDSSHLKCAELSEKRAPRRMRRRQRPPEISQGATFAESVR